MKKPPIDERADEPEDLPLFPRAGVRNSDPDTSFDAAQSLDPDELTRLEKLVLDNLAFAREAGMTTMEISVLSHIKRDSLSPRIRHLRDLGLVVDSGERRTGVAPSEPCPTCGNVMNGSKRRCIVWVLKSFYREPSVATP